MRYVWKVNAMFGKLDSFIFIFFRWVSGASLSRWISSGLFKHAEHQMGLVKSHTINMCRDVQCALFTVSRKDADNFFKQHCSKGTKDKITEYLLELTSCCLK